jgi:hypothetical protein
VRIGKVEVVSRSEHADVFLESVAELAEKPLYSVTCGDIGTEPDAVESYLRRVLYFGKTWNCGECATCLWSLGLQTVYHLSNTDFLFKFCY